MEKVKIFKGFQENVDKKTGATRTVERREQHREGIGRYLKERRKKERKS